MSYTDSLYQGNALQTQVYSLGYASLKVKSSHSIAEEEQRINIFTTSLCTIHHNITLAYLQGNTYLLDNVCRSEQQQLADKLEYLWETICEGGN